MHRKNTQSSRQLRTSISAASIFTPAYLLLLASVAIALRLLNTPT